ncbi:major facilitator superfamily domain-containing protein [Aspergillus pseudoustus]|uniref:Major facilitator superfamily domain-containing protein n=1 Tax=Aspergillus pseudoustus TaxID=1810923 RepID=A0ABR4IRH5_9EURO
MVSGGVESPISPGIPRKGEHSAPFPFQGEFVEDPISPVLSLPNSLACLMVAAADQPNDHRRAGLGLPLAIANHLARQDSYWVTLGPILGGVITNSIGWRWLFWVLSIFDGALTFAAIFWFPECYEQVLLHWKASKLRKETGGLPYHTEWDIHSQPLATKLKRSVSRPFWLLATQPILQIISIFLAYNFGTLYLVLTELASVWTDRYHHSVSVSGLHYISLAAKPPRNTASHSSSQGSSSPAGLLIYGWAAQALAPGIVVDIGATFFNLGIIMSTQSDQQYVMEAFNGSGHVATASAASQFLRNIFAFCFPLFAPAMYGRLGQGWGNSLLAFVFFGIGVPAPVVLWRFGARLRTKGGRVL